jgi:hypothetical protein
MASTSYGVDTPLMRETELKAAGNVMFKEGKLDAAAAQYYAALAVSHGRTCVLLQNLSTAYLRQDQTELALVHALAATVLNEDAPPAKACFKAARAAQALGQADAARAALQLVPAEQRSPACDALMADLGRSDASSEGLSIAGVLASQALEHAPPEASITEKPTGQPDAAAAYREGRIQDAIHAWRAELLQRSAHAAVLSNLAQVQLGQQRWAAAAGSASAALVWDPCNLKSWYRQVLRPSRTPLPRPAPDGAFWTDAARSSCQHGLRLDAGNAPHWRASSQQ